MSYEQGLQDGLDVARQIADWLDGKIEVLAHRLIDRMGEGKLLAYMESGDDVENGRPFKGCDLLRIVRDYAAENGAVVAPGRPLLLSENLTPSHPAVDGCKPAGFIEPEEEGTGYKFRIYIY